MVPVAGALAAVLNRLEQHHAEYLRSERTGYSYMLEQLRS